MVGRKYHDLKILCLLIFVTCLYTNCLLFSNFGVNIFADVGMIKMLCVTYLYVIQNIFIIPHYCICLKNCSMPGLQKFHEWNYLQLPGNSYSIRIRSEMEWVNWINK